MIDVVFAWCVRVLVWLAQTLGITYEAVNVWIFVVIWPLATLALMVLVAYQKFRIQALQQACQDYPYGAAI